MRNFKRFLRMKVGETTSRGKDNEDKGKVIKREFKIV